MNTGIADLPNILLVEDDADISLAMETALGDEGYRLTTAPSPKVAHALVDERTFDLILADVFPTNAADLLASVDALRQHANPTPVVLVTARRMEEAKVTTRGFRAYIMKPFDLEHLLVTVAACLDRQLSAEQERQAETVRRYFAALSAKDWDGLAALCTEDVTYVLPGTTSFAQVVSGRAAFREFSATTFAQFPDAQFTDVAVYATPLGLAARYMGRWHAPDGAEVCQAGAVAFRFAGDQIAHIGIQLNAERLERVTTDSRSF